MNITTEPSAAWPRSVKILYKGEAPVCIYLNRPGSKEAVQFGEGNIDARNLNWTPLKRVL